MSEAIAVSGTTTAANTGKGLNDMTQPVDAPAASAAFSALMQGLVIIPPAPVDTASATAAATLTATSSPTLPGTLRALGAQGGLDTPLAASPELANAAPPINPGAMALVAGRDWLHALAGRTLDGGSRASAAPDESDTGPAAGSLFATDGLSIVSGDALPAQSEPSDPGSPGSLMHHGTGGIEQLATGLVAGPPEQRAAPLVLDAKLPLLSSRFADGFAQQVTVLVEHGVQHAQLSLNPPELGPIDIRISVQDDAATIHLASQHGAVRDAMTEALPRLRELLDQVGVRLGEAGVSTHLPQRESPAGGNMADRTNADRRNGPWTGPDDAAPELGPTVMSLRLVDAYV